MIDLVLQIPGVVQHESVIDRLRRGEVVLAAPPRGRDPHVIDGVRSPHPVHHSKDLGWMLWLSEQVERVYAPHVDDLDAPLAEPHLIAAPLAHARAAGFATVNLLDAFAPHATDTSRQLLYFRDDDHWSPRGHAVVAEVLAGHLAGADARQPPSPDQQLRAAGLRG